MLTLQAIEELKVIHKRNFGVDLTDEEAEAMGNRLLRIFSVLLREPHKPAEESAPLAELGPPQPRTSQRPDSAQLQMLF